jgi:hypothetical protein
MLFRCEVEGDHLRMSVEGKWIDVGFFVISRVREGKPSNERCAPSSERWSENGAPAASTSPT